MMKKLRLLLFVLMILSAKIFARQQLLRQLSPSKAGKPAEVLKFINDLEHKHPPENDLIRKMPYDLKNLNCCASGSIP